MDGGLDPPRASLSGRCPMHLVLARVRADLGVPVLAVLSKGIEPLDPRLAGSFHHLTRPTVGFRAPVGADRRSFRSHRPTLGVRRAGRRSGDGCAGRSAARDSGRRVQRRRVEMAGLEPATPCMPCRCATNCATPPGVERPVPIPRPRRWPPGLGGRRPRSRLMARAYHPAVAGTGAPPASRSWTDRPL